MKALQTISMAFDVRQTSPRCHANTLQPLIKTRMDLLEPKLIFTSNIHFNDRLCTQACPFVGPLFHA